MESAKCDFVYIFLEMNTIFQRRKIKKNTSAEKMTTKFSRPRGNIHLYKGVLYNAIEGW